MLEYSQMFYILSDIYEKKIKERKRNEAIESKAIEAYIKAGQP